MHQALAGQYSLERELGHSLHEPRASCKRDDSRPQRSLLSWGGWLLGALRTPSDRRLHRGGRSPPAASMGAGQGSRTRALPGDVGILTSASVDELQRLLGDAEGQLATSAPARAGAWHTTRLGRRTETRTEPRPGHRPRGSLAHRCRAGAHPAGSSPTPGRRRPPRRGDYFARRRPQCGQRQRDRRPLPPNEEATPAVRHRTSVDPPPRGDFVEPRMFSPPLQAQRVACAPHVCACHTRTMYAGRAFCRKNRGTFPPSHASRSCVDTVFRADSRAPSGYVIEFTNPSDSFGYQPVTGRT